MSDDSSASSESLADGRQQPRSREIVMSDSSVSSESLADERQQPRSREIVMSDSSVSSESLPVLSISNRLQVSIVSPYGSVFKGEALRLRAPGTDGGLEIRRRHAPMIASLSAGAVILTLPNSEKLTYATSGGFVEVLGNVVTVLGETVEPASEIDLDRARAAEERARARLAEAGNDLDLARARRALARARNRTRIGMGRVGQRLSP